MRIIISLYLVFYSFLLSAQIKNEKRIELDEKDGFSEEELITADHDGFLLLSSNKHKDGKQWWIQHFDTLLNKSGENFFISPKRATFVSQFKLKNSFVILMNNKKKHLIYQITIPLTKPKVTEIEKLPKMIIDNQKLINNRLYFSGNIKRKPVLYSVDLTTGVKTVHSLNTEEYDPKFTTNASIEADPSSGLVYLFLNHKNEDKTYDNIVFIYDDMGQLTGRYVLNKRGSVRINEGTGSRTGMNSFFFAGTYGSTQGYSEGIFFTKTEGNDLVFKTKSFLDFSNFLRYLPERRVERIEKKKQRKESKGKDFQINYRIALHPVIQANQRFILIGEAYYPTYHTYTTTTPGPNGTTTTTTHRVFDGYYYTHAFISALDEALDMEWDQVFEMRPSVKPMTVKRFIKVAQNPHTVNMAFASGFKIHTMAVDYDGTIESEQSSEDIDTGSEDDKTVRSAAEIESWYRNLFLMHGNQKIKNKEEGGKKSRRVYFISKISFG